MKRLVIALGLWAAMSSSAAAFDRNTQPAGTGDPALDILLQIENNVARRAFEKEPKTETRRANLPQNTNAGAPKKKWWAMSGEEELREIAKYNPHVKEYLELEDARARNDQWSRRRHKVGEGGAGRIGDIHAHDRPETLTWEEFDRMSTLDKFKNRGVPIKPPTIVRNKSESGVLWKQKRD